MNFPVDLEAVDKLHEHMDNCAQCMNEPWNLCGTGDRLIRETVKFGGKNEHT